MQAVRRTATEKGTGMTSINITSKEIIQRIVAHDAPPRIGFDFGDRSDLCFVGSRRHVNVPENPFDNWGQYSELEALTGFHGETGLLRQHLRSVPRQNQG